MALLVSPLGIEEVRAHRTWFLCLGAALINFLAVPWRWHDALPSLKTSWSREMKKLSLSCS